MLVTPKLETLYILLTRNLGLSRKHLYMSGIESAKGTAKLQNRYLQVGRRFITGKKIGAPAHKMFNMLKDIALNRVATLDLQKLIPDISEM